jgi:hypothetical protein
MPISLVKFQNTSNPPQDVFINPFYVTKVQAGPTTARGPMTNIYLAEPSANSSQVVVLAPVDEVVRHLGS